MAKELPYLASYKNVEKLFQKIDAAKKPDAITTRTLADTFGLKNTSDRQLITLLKTLGFLDQSGKPTAEYDLLKNPAQAKGAIAAATRKAYGPLFDADENAHLLGAEPLRGLIAQVTGADKGIASKIAGTFNTLVRLADFKHRAANLIEEEDEIVSEAKTADLPEDEEPRGRTRLRPEFHYNIQVHLPANGTEESYLHIFNAIRKTFR